MYYASNFYVSNNNTYNELTDIVIPNEITSIGNYQFLGFENVISFIIHSNVITIGCFAFIDCNKATIYCEMTSMPSGWDRRWNFHNIEVIWND